MAFDARDALATPLRGWGRYARELLAALPSNRMLPLGGGARPQVPEVLWEQVAFPLRAAARGAALLHAPNCFLPLARSLPGVVTVHDLAFEVHPEDFSARTGSKYRWCTPRAARSAERVICVSSFTAADVIERYGVPEERVRVIPNAPSLPVGTAPVPAPADGPYLLAVGDVRGKKNLARLVEAWRGLGSGAPRLVLAGHGEWQGELPAGVTLTGYLSDLKLDALLRGAAALVHPSLYEGFGLVVAEAMARGVPVACAGTTALPETAGGAAVLFDPLDVADIARGIAEALARADELRGAGLVRSMDWSWSACAAATLAVYEELL